MVITGLNVMAQQYPVPNDHCFNLDVNVQDGPPPIFLVGLYTLASGKLLHSYGKSLFLMGKSTISDGHGCNSFLYVYQRVAIVHRDARARGGPAGPRRSPREPAAGPLRP